MMQENKNNSKDLTSNYLYKEDFNYTSKNPYHFRLEQFDDFVLRDEEAEANIGSWSKNIFKNDNPLEVEIGTGYGHFMIEYTQKNPGINFIGMDHRFKRSFQLARKLSSCVYKNFRYLRARGERSRFMFADNEVQRMFYFFPDPWPKNRHHKKRLFQRPFLEDCSKILKPGGELLVKTDHDDYFTFMLKVVDKNLKDFPQLKLTLSTTDLYQTHPDHFLSSFQTKFEKIFLSQNQNINALVIKKDTL